MVLYSGSMIFLNVVYKFYAYEMFTVCNGI